MATVSRYARRNCCQVNYTLGLDGMPGMVPENPARQAGRGRHLNPPVRPARARPVLTAAEAKRGLAECLAFRHYLMGGARRALCPGDCTRPGPPKAGESPPTWQSATRRNANVSARGERQRNQYPWPGKPQWRDADRTLRAYSPK